METNEVASEDQSSFLEAKRLKFERYKFHWNLLKWFIVSVAIVSVGKYIENGFKERATGIQEMKAFDKYIEVVLKADNIEERWKLSQFFSTVTPTERLRNRWQEYANLVKPEYEKYKKLKDSAANYLRKGKSPEIINRYNEIKKELEPYEKRLTNVGIQSEGSNHTTNPITYDLPTQPNSSGIDGDQRLKAFREELRKDSIFDTRFKLDDYFNNANNINNSVVQEMVKDLGEPFTTIQTAYDRNYKTQTLSNHYGIVSRFDETKKIWPVFQAKVAEKDLVITLNTLEKNDSIETFKTSTVHPQWNEAKDFVRAFYIKRLDQLK